MSRHKKRCSHFRLHLKYHLVLSVICICAVLSVEVLVANAIWSWLNLWVNLLGEKGHLCHLFKDYCVVYCLVCILAPSEWAVVFADNTRDVFCIDSSLLEGFDDNLTCVYFICFIDFFRSKVTCTWNGSTEIICMSCSI